MPALAGSVDPNAQMLQMIKSDPVLGKSILVAEPWDPGPGGYQLGQFGKEFREWNDTYRDEIREFWRGEPGKIGALAGKVAGSAEIYNFAGRKPNAGVNFLAVHLGPHQVDECLGPWEAACMRGQNAIRQ